MAASDARPVPRKNAAWRYYFALRKPSDSTLITGWTGADSEVSLDGAAYSDCTNEATEIGTTGTGYIDLTAAEMNADAVMLKITITNTGAVPYVFTFYPEEAGDYRVDSSNSSVGSVSGAVGSVTGAVGSVTGNVGGNVNGNVTGSVGSVSGSVGSVTGSVGSVTGSVGSVVGNVGGSVASVAGAVGSVTGSVGGDVAGKVLGGGSGTISGDGVRAASVTGAVGSVTGSVGSVVAGVTISGTLTTLDAIWNKIKAWLGAIAGKTADTVTRAEINATTAGASYNETTDSLEAVRDRGDTAWVTGGGGGGDATLAKQEEILDAIDAYITGVQAAAADDPGTIVGFPASLKVGDSYTEATNNSISISILDESDNPVTSWGDFSTATTGFTPELYITLAGNAGRIKAVVTHDATPESHYVVEFPVEVWKRASAGTGTMQFVLRWYDTNGKVVAQRTIVAAQAVSLTGEI